MPYLTKQEMAILTMQAKTVDSPLVIAASVTEAVSAVSDLVSLLQAYATLDTFVPSINAHLGAKLGTAQLLRWTNISDVPNVIKGTVNADYTLMIELLKRGMAQRVGGMHLGLYDNLVGANALVGSVNGLIQRAGIDPYISRWVNTNIRPNIPEAQTAWFMNLLGVLDDQSYYGYFAENGWDDRFKTALERTWIRPIPIDIILDLERRGTLDADSAKFLLRWHGYSEEFTELIEPLNIQVPEPYRLADFAAKGILDDKQTEYYFKWFGLRMNWWSIWKESQQVYPNLTVGLELLWRGHIGIEAFRKYLRRSGFLPEDITAMEGLQNQIPPAQDIITMVVREAFDPKYVIAAPTEFSSWMLKKGFGNEWSDRYWTAHFLPMPINQAYDNLRRGYWSKEQFLELLRIADIHPTWREDIYNVAFNPPSIREMGYGYDVGVYSIADIVRFRRWGGLSEVDAAKAGQAMVAYRTEAEREAVRREYLYLYALGKIDVDTFEANLITIGTAPEAVPLWIERGTLQKIRKETETSVTEPKTVTRSDIQWLFENGLRNETWFRSALDTIGYSESSIQAYLDQSKKRIADKIKPPVPEEPKKLTLAMIQNLVEDGLIDANEATVKIVSLGYSASDAAMILQIMYANAFPAPEPKELSDAQISALYDYDLVSEVDILEHFKVRGYTESDTRLLTQLTVINSNLPDLKVMYSKGWINANQLFEGIKALGIPMDFVEPSIKPKVSKLIEVVGLPDEKAKRLMLTIVKMEQQTRTETERDLTKAEIVKGVKVGVLTAVEGVSLLQSMGYSEDESWYILAINKVLAAGDPEGYWDMRRVTELAKKARGEPSVTVPAELVALEKQQKSTLAQLNSLKASQASEVDIGNAAVSLAGVEARMHTIVAKLKLT